MKIVQATGQTCNQFWIYSNYLAEAIEKNEKFAIWVPDIAFEHYPNLLNSKFISYPLYSRKLASLFGHKKYIKVLRFIFLNKFLIKLFQIVVNAVPRQSFSIETVNVQKSKHKIKHLKELLTHYTPSEMIVSKAECFIKTIRQDYEIIIGVHIRYGDYRTFNNGKYFYTLEQYASFLKYVTDFLKEGQTAFFITSNEDIDRSFFKDYKCYYWPNGSMAEDNFILSKTDYILGAPSTFSAWASLYQETPIYFIENAKKDFTKKDFIDVKQIWF